MNGARGLAVVASVVYGLGALAAWAWLSPWSLWAAVWLAEVKAGMCAVGWPVCLALGVF